MEWLYFLLEANLYLLLFYGFYRLFLERTTFYNGNRYYLIISVLLSFCLPLIQLGFIKPAILQYNELTLIQTKTEEFHFGIENCLLYLYIVICGYFALKFMLKLHKIYLIWRKGNKQQHEHYTMVELKDHNTVFSFFNILFIHPSLINKKSIIKHEMVHIKQMHSSDIILMEFLQVIAWFNPIIYLIKNDLKLVHEYIADQYTTDKGIAKHDYAMLLIENSLNNFSTPLTNQFFNQSIIKRRINMLNKEKTAKWARLNFVLVAPLVGGMLCLSTLGFSKDYGYFDILPNAASQQDTTKKVRKPLPPPPPKKDKVKFPPPIVKPDGKNLKTPPPVEPPPPPKKDRVKFPPPIVKPDGKNLKTPPPPVEPRSYKVKKDKIKFPPPIIKKDEKNGEKLVSGDPVNGSGEKVKFPPPIVKSDKKN